MDKKKSHSPSAASSTRPCRCGWETKYNILMKEKTILEEKLQKLQDIIDGKIPAPSPSKRTGRPPKPFADLGEAYAARKLDDISAGVNVLLDDCDLVMTDQWKQRFWDVPYWQQTVINNLVSTYNALPAKSKIRSTFVHQFFVGVKQQDIAETLVISQPAVSQLLA